MSSKPKSGPGKKKTTLTLSEFQALNSSILPSAPSTVNTATTSTLSFRADNFPPIDMTKLPENPPFTAYIGNLPYDLHKDDIVKAFPKSTVVTVKLVRDKVDDKPKGHGYVEFEDLQSLKFALELNGKLELGGRRIRVDISESTGKSQSGRFVRQGQLSGVEISRRSEPVEGKLYQKGVRGKLLSEFEISRRIEPLGKTVIKNDSQDPMPEITRNTEPVLKKKSFNSFQNSFSNWRDEAQPISRSSGMKPFYVPKKEGTDDGPTWRSF